MNMIRVLLALACLAGSALAQTRVLTEAEMTAKSARVVTNGDLEGSKQFDLLVIGERATNAGLLRMLGSPRSQQLASWTSNCNLQHMEPGDPKVAEHHMDLVQKHQQLPILALLDRSGGVWWSGAGSQIPLDEVQLASTLSTFYAATMQAKSTQPQVNQVANSKPQNYYIPRNTGGPQPFNPDSSRRPLINPQIDHNLQIPSNLGATVQGSLDPETRRALYFAGGMVFLCTILVVGGFVIGATIIGNAITDDDDDKDVLEHLRSVMPQQFSQQVTQ